MAGLPISRKDNPMRQFVVCKFRETDTRSYTYHHDGEPVMAGDSVRVMDRSGDGWKKVLVVDTHHDTPSFATKPIIGLHVENEAAPETAEHAGDPLDSPIAF